MSSSAGRLIVAAALVGLLGGCIGVNDAQPGDSDQGDPRTSVGAPPGDDVLEGAPGEEHLFYGTREEHSVAMMACLERAGAVVRPEPGTNVGFQFELVGPHDDELIRAVGEACQGEVGHYVLEQSHPDPEGLYEALYEHGLWQRECLIELGYDMPPPPTFERYLETLDYDVFGSDGAGLRGEELHFALQDCPNYDEWAHQQGQQGSQP